MKRRTRRAWCWLVGHRFERKQFDGRGRRIEFVICTRCRHFDPDAVSVLPRNRTMRRRYARSIAREIAR